jgi:hypothetical protein
VEKFEEKVAMMKTKDEEHMSVPRYRKIRGKKTPGVKLTDREILRDLLLNDPEFNELLRSIVADIVAGNQRE